MLKKILILIMLFTTMSSMNAYSNNNDSGFASSAMIFWKSQSSNPESEIKNLLSDFSIEYKDLESQTWDSKTATIGGIRDIKLSQISENSDNWVSLMLHLNSNLIDKLSLGLSKLTDSPVIAFLEYDQDAWGYCLYEDGEQLDSFWNSYATVELDRKTVVSDVDLLSSKFHVDKDNIKPYLIDIINKPNLGKAFESD